VRSAADRVVVAAAGRDDDRGDDGRGPQYEKYVAVTLEFAGILDGGTRTQGLGGNRRCCEGQDGGNEGQGTESHGISPRIGKGAEYCHWVIKVKIGLNCHHATVR